MSSHLYNRRPETLERRLSIEETYQLAYTARRKSSTEASRNDLRLRVGHANMLEAIENVIRNSPPPSPKQPTLDTVKSNDRSRHVSWTASPAQVSSYPEVDEYGFEYDDGEEDMGGLSLCRTASRREER